VFQQECETVLRYAEKSNENVLIMKNNMNTTLEIPEGSKATILGCRNDKNKNRKQ